MDAPPGLDEHTDLDLAVLEALVEGFRARAGTKERFQALSEYEVARRVGVVSYSFVEYDSSPERGAIGSALSRLQGRGLVRVASMTGRYETYVPTDDGQRHLDEQRQAPPAERAAPTPRPEPAPQPSVDAAPVRATPPPTTIDGRMDEMIRLLRSIDERLERIERG